MYQSSNEIFIHSSHSSNHPSIVVPAIHWSIYPSFCSAISPTSHIYHPIIHSTIDQSIRLFIEQSVHLSNSSFMQPSIHLSYYLVIILAIDPTHLSFQPYIHPFSDLFLHSFILSVSHPTIHLNIQPYIHPSRQRSIA